MRDLIGRLGEKAGIEGVRCSAHTFRHTHALSYLRCGGSVEGLKERLGHENIKMTLKYVALAEADMGGQRRFRPGFSPGRGTKPQRASRAKLSDEDVRAVKRLLKKGVARGEIAWQFGVSVYAIKGIALGYSWRQIDV